MSTPLADFNTLVAAVGAALVTAFPVPTDLDPAALAVSVLSDATKKQAVGNILIWMVRNGLITTSSPRIENGFINAAVLTIQGMRTFGMSLPTAITAAPALIDLGEGPA